MTALKVSRTFARAVMAYIPSVITTTIHRTKFKVAIINTWIFIPQRMPDLHLQPGLSTLALEAPPHRMAMEYLVANFGSGRDDLQKLSPVLTLWLMANKFVYALICLSTTICFDLEFVFGVTLSLLQATIIRNDFIHEFTHSFYSSCVSVYLIFVQVRIGIPYDHLPVSTRYS